MPPAISDYVPVQFRLAELLGLGTNSVHIEISFVDGKLFTASEYGFEIQQRLRHDVVGLFHFRQSAGDVETFRQMIESRSRIATREINLGPEVKPHKVGFRSISARDSANDWSGSRAWEKERLDRKVALESRSVGRSKNQANAEEELESAINTAILTELQAIQNQIVEAQASRLIDSPDLNTLTMGVRPLREWEAIHVKFSGCMIREASSELVDGSILADGIWRQLEQKRPMLLSNRLPEQTRLANLALAHGLLHRVPEKAQLDALQLILYWIQNL